MKHRDPEIAIVGAGRVARVLAHCLRKEGYRVTAILSRHDPASKRRAGRLARAVGAKVLGMTEAAGSADLYWICVPDDEIGRVATQLGRQGDWKDKYVFHASGALPASALRPLRRKGARVASVHPMHTFLPDSPLTLRSIPFGLEGDAAAVRKARTVALRLNHNGLVYPVRADRKVLYHALGSFSSPMLVSLLEAGAQVGRAAGLRRPDAVRWSILRTTLENYRKHGASAAFGGPIRRADLGTIRRHLQALRSIPLAREIYLALARNAAVRLPVKDRKAVRRLLDHRSR
jgi:predicted short-subunit dehydrogenase-like oxidoreductase (DUF2520 family)